ncbi:phage tail tape measure protein [Pseudomonas frederiksbergensis]|uniref:phage tail tape measure protein n=1 Tax=Pseudomonas frederiksbergensis TaxID=104087 RepID=UPI000F49D914|nr:phage tail tape measure protein [Pseudomonas frederiksbergensis]RON56964.1 phage tail tape measure protein [Pseudomonas frederiksbergensis]
MADDRYSLKYAALDDSGLAFGSTSMASAGTGVLSAQGMGSSARDLLSGLGLALENVGLKLGLLTTAIESLNLKISSQRLLSQTMGAGAKSEPANEKSAGKPGNRIEPPDLLKPAIEMDSAMADLKQAAQLTPRQSAEMVQSTQHIASAPLVAAGGTKAVDLVKIESLAATAGIASDLPNASDRQFELLRFASDAGVAASAFKMPALDVAEMMAAWRTSMKLSGPQAFDLADATNHLGKIPGGAKAADIGAVLQRDGVAATTAGLMPAQAAALTAALLNTGTQKSDAGAALNSITTAMAKGDQVSASERVAWQQLKLDPVEVAGLLRQQDKAPGAVMSVLAALNAQPAENRSRLATTLFANGDEAAVRMSRNLPDVSQAFWQVSDNRQYATSQLGDKGSVKQDALVQSRTQQGQWNVLNARNDRLSLASGNALLPMADSALGAAGSVTDRLSELAETHPKTTAAVVIVMAAIKPLVSTLFKSIADEVSSQAAKGVLGKVAPRLPGRLGELISEDFRKTGGTPKPDLKLANAAMADVELGPMRGLSGSLSPVKRLIPLATALSVAPMVVEGVMNGDARMVGAGLGTAGGAWAGVEAGAVMGGTAGAFLGPFGAAFGGLAGAAVGGLAGSWIGQEMGARLGEKLSAPADRLLPPDQAAKDLTNAQTNNQQNTVNANIYINGLDSPNTTELANLVVQHLSNQFAMMTTTNQLAVRRDTALTDGVA